MKTRYITMVMTSALLTIGLIPLGSAQPAVRNAPEGIEVITVVGKRATPEGIEVITVVGKRPTLETPDVVGARPAPGGIEVITVVARRPEPTVASTCVNEVMAGRVAGARNASDYFSAQTLESRLASRDGVRQAIRDCIDKAELTTTHS